MNKRLVKEALALQSDAYLSEAYKQIGSDVLRPILGRVLVSHNIEPSQDLIDSLEREVSSLMHKAMEAHRKAVQLSCESMALDD